ncbi:hypothetical protein LOK49_LG13G00542 [Camellia lanceoleosa]|uniref:Uncharacterized protein n=1 Tax=Camellia lanceoleosa TaxID=1840588 RepID=A0ACC0FJ85_9ERIC|nr:hypothetical protein LOK49_LG13G00542 [Camellia lanceoleosa]
MPQPKEEGGDIVLGLGALDGCLCMTRFFHPRNFGGKIEVLAMKEYGVKSSWTLMFSLSNLIGFHPRDQFVPLCTTKNQEVIMKMCSRSIMNRLRAYNPIDNSYWDIPLPAKYYSIEAVIYEENLITPPAYDWEEEELRRGSNICGNFSFGLYSKIETDKERMEILESLRI